MHREYAALIRRLETEINLAMSAHERMSAFVDLAWEFLSSASVSWVGFYLEDRAAPDDQRLTLGPRRDSPACSPIGLHGVCGQAYTSRRTKIVRNVKTLGENYVPCNPNDRSEIVIPLLSDSRNESNPATTSQCWGVLDLDSWDIAAFDESDAHNLITAMQTIGFIPPTELDLI